MNDLTWFLIEARTYAQDYLEDQQELLDNEYLDNDILESVKANIELAQDFIERVTAYAQQHKTLIDAMP